MRRHEVDLVREYAHVREQRAALILLRREVERSGHRDELGRIDHALTRLKYRNLLLRCQLAITQSGVVHEYLQRAGSRRASR
jgi:hypothetical protein